MAKQAWFQGEGGSVILMDLPLPDVYAAQEAQGRLNRVNPDGSPWSTEPVVESEADREAREQAEDEARPVGPVKPSRADNKAAWVDYAKLSSDVDHDEIESMTKAQLVDRFG